MSDYKLAFIDFLVEQEALQFGEFTLKSGRTSPYFFNSAAFNSGQAIERLGYFYAAAVQDFAPDSTLVFGPAYKGIPLCVATVTALASHFQCDIGYFFNRKEAKSHGDKGLLVGQAPKDEDRMVMVDDVMTDGGTKREALKMVQQLTNAKFSGILIAVDRMEANQEGKDSLAEFQKDTGIPIHAIVTIEDICTHLLDREINGRVYLTQAIFHRIEAYLQMYRVRQ